MIDIDFKEQILPRLILTVAEWRISMSLTMAIICSSIATICHNTLIIRPPRH